MKLDPAVLAAIAGMAVVTYALRAGGYLLFRTVPTPPWLRTGLSYVPGALFVSYVAPTLAAGGWPEWAGGAATVGLMIATRSAAVAILGGTAAAWVVWRLM